MNPHYCLYVLVRQDLPSLNPGKAMAQVAHAANAFIFKWAHKKIPGINLWQGKEGFGTTIVLSIPNIIQLNNILLDNVVGQLKTNAGIPFGHVLDNTYPYIVNSEILPLIDAKLHTQNPIIKENGQVICFRKEITCGYLFIDKTNPEQFKIVSELSLHP